MNGYILLVGRLLMAALFLGSATGKILDPAGTQYYMTLMGMPMAQVLMWAAVAVELAGAIALLVGWQVRWAAIPLIAYVTAATLIFHMNLADPIQYHSFLANCGIIGGLLYIVGAGAGAFSLDESRRRAAGLAPVAGGLAPSAPSADPR